MIDSQKRMTFSYNKSFQERCKWFMYQHAKTVLENETPDTDDLKLAQNVWAGGLDYQNVALIMMTNATIGAHVDNDENITDSEIQYVITTENKFNTIAQTLVAAGVI